MVSRTGSAGAGALGEPGALAPNAARSAAKTADSTPGVLDSGRADDFAEFQAARRGSTEACAGPAKAIMPATFMIVPLPRASMSGNTARVSMVGATTLTCTSSRACCAGSSTIGR